MKSYVYYRLAGIFLVLAIFVATWTLAVSAALPAVPQDVPGGSTVSGVRGVDEVWGPGAISVTGDITILSGVTIIIAPGTTVQISTTDGLNSGVDLTLIEWIISGTLQTNGPVTFTSQGSPPACADWYGLRFMPGSDGYLDGATVEYGTHGVVISTTNRITITGSALRYNCHTPTTGDAWGAGMAIFTGDHYVVNTHIYSNSLLSNDARAIGAGVRLEAGSTLFEDCLVYDNRAETVFALGDGFGGGLTLWGGGAPTLHHCEVYQNIVTGTLRAFGGGVDIDDTDAVIEADTFIHDNVINTTAYIAPDPFTIDAYGGGVHIGAWGGNPTPIIRDSRVTTNTCEYVGGGAGAICTGGGVGFFDGSKTRAVISDSLIADNVSRAPLARGGGIGMGGGATADLFDSNLIRDNVVEAGGFAPFSYGGGICVDSSAIVSVTNNLLFNNRARYSGGIIPLPSGNGGGIFSNGELPYLVNNTVVSNAAGINGGGVYLGNSVLSNTIVVSNTAGGDGGGVYVLMGTTNITGYNDVWGNVCSGPGCGAEYDSGSVAPATDICADPLFVGAGDVAAYYHLQQGSPCVDTGTSTGRVPDHDYDDQPRPLGYGHEIGFDEMEYFIGSKMVDRDTAGWGAELVYTLIITNPNPSTVLLNGWVTDVLPISTTYASGPNCSLPSCGYDSGSRTVWWNGDVPANAALICDYTVIVNDGLPYAALITNTAFFTVAGIGGWTNEISTTIYPPIGGFTMVFTASTPPVYMPMVLRPYR